MKRKLTRPHVVAQDIEASYREMAGDEAREQQALEWCEGLIAWVYWPRMDTD